MKAKWDFENFTHENLLVEFMNDNNLTPDNCKNCI